MHALHLTFDMRLEPTGTRASYAACGSDKCRPQHRNRGILYGLGRTHQPVRRCCCFLRLHKRMCIIVLIASRFGVRLLGSQDDKRAVQIGVDLLAGLLYVDARTQVEADFKISLAVLPPPLKYLFARAKG